MSAAENAKNVFGHHASTTTIWSLQYIDHQLGCTQNMYTTERAFQAGSKQKRWV